MKVISFPIEKAQSKDDEVLQKDKKLEAYKEAEIDKAIDAANEEKAVNIEKK